MILGTSKQKFWRTFFAHGWLKPFSEIRSWKNRGFGSPSPSFIKLSCLAQHRVINGDWIETGTYLGLTTKFLSQLDSKSTVYTIEPEPNLFLRAQKIFESVKKIQVLNGLSEEIFPTLLPKLSGGMNFWLDGHFSAGVTFQGPVDTPILLELKSIEANISKFDQVSIFIDDVRCFDPNILDYSTYPPLVDLVNWAERNKFSWTIEHDIFIAKNWRN